MVRVLQITSIQCGGAENVLMNYYRKLDKKEVQFDFFVKSEGNEFFEEEIKKLGGTIYRTIGKRKFINQILLLSKIKKNGYCAVEIHTENAHSVYWVVILKLLGYKNIIVHSHSTNNKAIFQHNVCKTILNKMGIIRFACGRDAAQFMFGNKEAYYVNNAINLEKFKSNEGIRKHIREMYNIDDSETLIGNVARFIKLKNQKYVIDVLAECINVGINSRALLVGDGELRNEIEAYAKERGLENKVIFTGNVRNVYDYMQAMDFFLLPSFYEGLPTVAIEAQAIGIKCLLSKNISDEVRITNLVHFLDINESPIIWKDKILDERGYKRECVIEQIRDRGFDIDKEVQKLTKMYKFLEVNYEQKQISKYISNCNS